MLKIASKMHREINSRLKGIGECAAIDKNRNQDGYEHYSAYLQIWDADFDDSGAVVRWFRDAGASEVSVWHCLHCTVNGDVDGATVEGSRSWVVHFQVSAKC